MGVPDVKPRQITDEDLGYWGDFVTERVTYAADDPDTMPCPALATLTPDPHGVVGTYVVRVAWELDTDDLARLVAGGTLWLSTWGGLPPHMLEVAPPADEVVPS